MPRGPATLWHDPPVVQDVAAAREQLERIADPWESWITSELTGGSVRAQRRHDEKQQAERMVHQAWCDSVTAIAELPDGDLAWLLSVGWQPEDVYAMRTTP